MKQVKVKEFLKANASDNHEEYIIRYEYDGVFNEVCVQIENEGMRIIKQLELESALGRGLSSLICRKLLDYIDGDATEFPILIKDD